MNFIIEVKSKWEKENDLYSRVIVHYGIDGTNEEYVEHFIKEIDSKKEYAKVINENNLEITAKTLNHRVIKKPNGLVKRLIDYTKEQWNYSE